MINNGCEENPTMNVIGDIFDVEGKHCLEVLAQQVQATEKFVDKEQDDESGNETLTVKPVELKKKVKECVSLGTHEK